MNYLDITFDSTLIKNTSAIQYRHTYSGSGWVDGENYTVDC